MTHEQLTSNAPMIQKKNIKVEIIYFDFFLFTLRSSKAFFLELFLLFVKDEIEEEEEVKFM